MTELIIGQEVPDFTLPASNGEEVTLSSYRGRKVVLYFYPKDMTPSCTQEACSFRDSHHILEEKGVTLLGVSPDPVKSHGKFANKYELPFLLLSDEEHKVSELYGVWQLKKMYGREYEGIVRSTFLIDEDGKLLKEWRKVRVAGHTDDILSAL
ncbi:thioredoxin-dependent thiol peroxidase [Paenibacillus dokdonensis]|uniref:thioredoxin-dependent thiol peroxidase n=1 Tax=Paenibacillus dokdonensis TaxID=2567944 RepID=UPI0010A77DA8|nr:thioredoxin-dependent thiol peroxidase [Paenibacillus dokdonensis]